MIPVTLSFWQLQSDVNIRDLVNPNTVIPVKKPKIQVIYIYMYIVPPSILVNRVLTEVVNRSIPDVDLNFRQSVEQFINVSTRWYEAYIDCFFQLIQPMHHEFMRDYLVVSTKHPDPMHAFSLNLQSNNMQNSSDKNKQSYSWFSNNILKYYLLLHDVSYREVRKADEVSKVLNQFMVPTIVMC